MGLSLFKSKRGANDVNCKTYAYNLISEKEIPGFLFHRYRRLMAFTDNRVDFQKCEIRNGTVCPTEPTASVRFDDTTV